MFFIRKNIFFFSWFKRSVQEDINKNSQSLGFSRLFFSTNYIKYIQDRNLFRFVEKMRQWLVEVDEPFCGSKIAENDDWMIESENFIISMWSFLPLTFQLKFFSRFRPSSVCPRIFAWRNNGKSSV